MAFGETIPADEAEKFRGFADEIARIQRERAAASGVATRVAHVKQHLGVVGELVVNAPESARVGVFAEPGKRWPLYARFSNGSMFHQSDRLPDPRGFALKLVGVPGKKLIEGLEHEVTQDFLFIDTPAIPFKNADEFMIFLRAAKDGRSKLLPRAIKTFGFFKTLGIIGRAVRQKKVESFATHAFHTAAPISFGSTAAKLALFPLASGRSEPFAHGDDYLRDDLTARLRTGPLSWALRAQRFVDEVTTPIENTAVEWSGPWLELGTLTLPQQDPESVRGKEIVELVNRLSFDPWHAGEEHRPLGAIMRARRATYGASVVGRKAAPEPREVLAS
jgi:hypothetical protein